MTAVENFLGLTDLFTSLWSTILCTARLSLQPFYVHRSGRMAPQSTSCAARTQRLGKLQNRMQNSMQCHCMHRGVQHFS